MVFKFSVLTRLVFCTFFGVFFGIIYLAVAVPTSKPKVLVPIEYALPVIASLYLVTAIIIFIYKEYYVLEKGVITIFKGSRSKKVLISEIRFININVFEGSNRHRAINLNTAYLVTNDGNIEINTWARNDRKQDIVKVLSMKYHKKIVYDGSLCKSNRRRDQIY